MNLIEVGGALLTGGVGVELVRRVLAPAEARQLDATAMRSELWKRVEKLETDLAAMRKEVAEALGQRNEARDEARVYRTAFERCDEQLRRLCQTVLMIVFLRERGDEKWAYWLERCAVESKEVPDFLHPGQSDTISIAPLEWPVAPASASSGASADASPSGEHHV